MRLYDSHCHLDLIEQPRRALERAREAGVERLLVPGVSLAQWQRTAELRARADALEEQTGVALRFALGLHPQFGDGSSVSRLSEAFEGSDPHAIGEFGWHRSGDGSQVERQDLRADSMLALAASLPIILHVVGQHGHALQWLRHPRRRRDGYRGVVHAYSGSAAQVAEYTALGLSLSFGPSVLRPGARRPLEAAAAIPRAHLLLETDAPDQRPPGKASGEPADLLAVARAVAAARGESLEDVAALTFENAVRLFG